MRKWFKEAQYGMMVWSEHSVNVDRNTDGGFFALPRLAKPKLMRERIY